MMDFKKKADLIWQVANLLRGDYKQSDYGKVIMPLTVLRRLDCVLKPTKEKVLDYLPRIKDKSDSAKDLILNNIAGQSNETAGEHFTPREVIKLMVNLLFIADSETLTKEGRASQREGCASRREGRAFFAPQTIDEYFEREVKPHLPGAWIDHSKTKVGYEINFTKYFYEFKPLR